jgi:hypothetical protein
VIKEVEDILQYYPEHPYQVAFSLQELRQKLIAHVLSQIPNYYTILEKAEELPEDPSFLYSSLEEEECLESLICDSIVFVFRENADWISRNIPQRENSLNEPSHWFG